MQLRNRSDYFPKLTLWTFYSYLLRGYQSLESKAADIEEFHWSRGKREIIIITKRHDVACHFVNNRESVFQIRKLECDSLLNIYIQRTIFNMKQARPWMLANMTIICQFHAHQVHQNMGDIFWAEIYWGRLF